jgi:hypothetical protein
MRQEARHMSPTPLQGVRAQSVAAPAPAQTLAYRQALAADRMVLQNERRTIQSALRDAAARGVDRDALTQRGIDLDHRIQALDRQIAAVDQSITGVPSEGAAVAADQPLPADLSDGLKVASAAGAIVLTAAVALLYVRSLSRRAMRRIEALEEALSRRFDAVERATDVVAEEIERLGEGQRYVARVLSGKGELIGADSPKPDGGRRR